MHCGKPNPDRGNTLQTLLPENQLTSRRHLRPPWQPLAHSWGSCSSPPVGCHRDPPALDLAQLGVRDLNLQRQAGHPDGDLHLGSEVLVGEVDNRAYFALHLLPVHKDRVTGVGDLGGRGGTRTRDASERDTLHTDLDICRSS